MTGRPPAGPGSWSRRSVAVALLALGVGPAQAQEKEPSVDPGVLREAGPDETQVLTLTNGSELVGRIVEDAERIIAERLAGVTGAQDSEPKWRRAANEGA